MTRYWFDLAAFMVCVSIDEGSSIHKIAALPLRRLLNVGEGFVTNTWVVLGLALVAGMVLIFFRFFVHLPATTRAQFALALGVYLIGAFRLEMAAAAVVTTINGSGTFTLALLQGGEEFLEMLGAILSIRALLFYPAM